MQKLSKKKIVLLAYGATLLVGLVLVVAILLIWNTFGQTDRMKVLINLCDAFFISGFVIFGIGGLSLISTTGFFDILAYGLKSVWFLFIKITYKKGEMERYIDYVQRKREAREQVKVANVPLYITLTGIFLIGVAAFFLIFIYA